MSVTSIKAASTRDYSIEIAIRLGHIVAIADLVQTLAQSSGDLIDELRGTTLYDAMHCIATTAEAASAIQIEADCQAGMKSQSD